MIEGRCFFHNAVLHCFSCQDAVRYIEIWNQLDKSLSFVRDKYILPRDQIEDEEDEDGDGSNSVCILSGFDGWMQ